VKDLSLFALTLALGIAGSNIGPRPASKVSGQVRYPDGRVAANCRVVVLHPAFNPLKETRCDSAGRYEVSLEPGTYNAIAILDDGYGKTTLEFWAWNVRVGGDLILDATIGKLEVYNLAVWNSKGGAPSLFVSFRPMSLERSLAKEPLQRRVVEGDTVMVQDLSPALGRGQIRIAVDGTETGIETFQWYYERFFDKAANAYRFMPVALLQLQRPALARGIHTVRVHIADARSGAIGEGVTWFESNEAGLGF
jgi:hypothetical protein